MAEEIKETTTPTPASPAAEQTPQSSEATAEKPVETRQEAGTQDDKSTGILRDLQEERAKRRELEEKLNTIEPKTETPSPQQPDIKQYVDENGLLDVEKFKAAILEQSGQQANLRVRGEIDHYKLEQAYPDLMKDEKKLNMVMGYATYVGKPLKDAADEIFGLSKTEQAKAIDQGKAEERQTLNVKEQAQTAGTDAGDVSGSEEIALRNKVRNYNKDPKGAEQATVELLKRHNKKFFNT